MLATMDERNHRLEGKWRYRSHAEARMMLRAGRAIAGDILEM